MTMTSTPAAERRLLSVVYGVGPRQPGQGRTVVVQYRHIGHARLVRLLIRARQFNATLLASDGVPFAALANRQGVSPSYFTRLVRLSYLAPDITTAILDGRQRAI
jgi:hypothetical protein